MEEDLFPVFDVPSDLADEADENDEGSGTEYAPGPLWDYETGDFVIDGAKRTIYGSGYDSWVLWCTKTIMTQRWAFLAYSDAHGVEADEAFAEPDRDAVESSFERTITEALEADPLERTLLVRNFDFTWLADSLEIQCEVVATDGSTADIEAKLPI